MNDEIREAIETDKQGITDVIVAAFGEEEGQVIDKLVWDLTEDPSAQPMLSLVATHEGRIVGHILFTNTSINTSQGTVSSTILAPLSVHPSYQRQGIGGRLIKAGLERLKENKVELVFVLGHPSYYPKFGFITAGVNGFEAPYPIAPKNSEAWMVQALRPGAIEQISGQVLCANAMSDPKYWQE